MASYDASGKNHPRKLRSKKNMSMSRSIVSRNVTAFVFAKRANIAERAALLVDQFKKKASLYKTNHVRNVLKIFMSFSFHFSRKILFSYWYLLAMIFDILLI